VGVAPLLLTVLPTRQGLIEDAVCTRHRSAGFVPSVSVTHSGAALCNMGGLGMCMSQCQRPDHEGRVAVVGNIRHDVKLVNDTPVAVAGDKLRLRGSILAGVAWAGGAYVSLVRRVAAVSRPIGRRKRPPAPI